MPENVLFSHLNQDGRDLSSSDCSVWQSDGQEAHLDRYWNGKSSLKEVGPSWPNGTWIRSAWTALALYFQIQCRCDVLRSNCEWNPEGDNAKESSDLVGLFLKPKAGRDYLEIGVTPLGQTRLARLSEPRLRRNFSWDPEVRIRIEKDSGSTFWTAYLCLPFASILEAQGAATDPMNGDAWRVNFYRLVGESSHREILTWRPTFTTEPSLLTMTSFGHLMFVGGPDQS